MTLQVPIQTNGRTPLEKMTDLTRRLSSYRNRNFVPLEKRNGEGDVADAEIHMFESPKLKIERAKEHIDHLNSVLADFFETDFCRLWVEEDPKDGMSVLKFEATRPLPLKVPLIIGDALHNLRTAIDYTYGEVVAKTGGRASKYTKFPFGYTKDALVGTANGRKIEEASAVLLDLIANTADPDKRGNNPLGALDHSDIRDKHIGLVPVIAAIAIVGASIVDENLNAFSNVTLKIAEGGKLDSPIRTGTKLHITKPGKPAFQVVFDKGQVFEGEAVIPSLYQLAQIVAGFVEVIEKMCGASGGRAHGDSTAGVSTASPS